MRVLVADDCAILADSLADRLSRESGITALGLTCRDAGDPVEAVDFDPTMVVFNPDSCTVSPEELKASHERLFGRHDSVALLPEGAVRVAHQCLKSGFSGAVSRGLGLESTVSAIQSIAAGGLYVDGCFGGLGEATAGTEIGGTGGLSDRERDVLIAVARGETAKLIARSLRISPKTVETHRSRAMSKLGICDRQGLTRHAVSHGWYAE